MLKLMKGICRIWMQLQIGKVLHLFQLVLAEVILKSHKAGNNGLLPTSNLQALDPNL